MCHFEKAELDTRHIWLKGFSTVDENTIVVSNFDFELIHTSHITNMSAQMTFQTAIVRKA